MKRLTKVLLCILLSVIVILTIVIGRLVHEGNHGKGLLSFLVYLQGPVQLTEEKYDYETINFSCENEGETIKGTLYVPADNAYIRKILIFSHGFNCQSQLLQNKAKSLASSGIATLIFDFRGGSLRGQSEGAMEDMTVYTEISDLNLVIDTVKEYKWVDSNEIYLVGESFGGLVSALTASKRDDIAGLILCFPALQSADSARANWSSINEIPETMAVNKLTTGKTFWEALWNMDVYGEITNYKGEVIILHGTEDQMVNPSYSVKANQVYNDSQLFLIEGAGHGFGGADAKSSLKTIYQFIMK